MHQDDGLEGRAALIGQLMERLLFAPALLQQGVAHHAGRACEARAEVEGDVGARLGAAAARQVDLKPAEGGAQRGRIINGAPGRELQGSLHVKRFGSFNHPDLSE